MYQKGIRTPPSLLSGSLLTAHTAMQEASITDPSRCYFVDDSTINCEAAIRFGWEKTVQKLEPGDPEPTVPVALHHIRSLEELRECFPELFKENKAGGIKGKFV